MSAEINCVRPTQHDTICGCRFWCGVDCGHLWCALRHQAFCDVATWKVWAYHAGVRGVWGELGRKRLKWSAHIMYRSHLTPVYCYLAVHQLHVVIYERRDRLVLNFIQYKHCFIIIFFVETKTVTRPSFLHYGNSCIDKKSYAFMKTRALQSSHVFVFV